MSNRFEVFPCRDLYFSSIRENLSFCCSTTLKQTGNTFIRHMHVEKDINTELMTYQLIAPQAASDNKHNKLLISRHEDDLFAPVLFPDSVLTFFASSLPFDVEVSATSSLCFGVFFLCFTSLGILT